jgi:hypothetical protein
MPFPVIIQVSPVKSGMGDCIYIADNFCVAAPMTGNSTGFADH